MGNNAAAPNTVLTQPRPLLAAWTLAYRELIRFFRQRNRVVGAIGQPVLFWLIFGAGLSPTFQMTSGAESIGYQEYFFPGILMLIVLFTAIFATISIIEDRHEGFLQSVLVAPVPRWAMVLGKVSGGTMIALIQAMIFLLLGLFTLDVPFSPLQIAAVVGYLAITGIGLTSLGFWIAWRIDSSQGYHAIMSIVLFPMWLLSGAFFPAGDNWLGYLIRANPLTYAMAGLRHLFYLGASEEIQAAALPASLPTPLTCAIVTVVATLVAFGLACRVSARRTQGDLH